MSPGDQMTAWVASNSTGTSFMLVIKDTTAGWSFSTTQSGQRLRPLLGRGDRRGALVVQLLFCSEVPLADFGQVGYSGSSLIDAAGKKGSLSAFNANEITMASNGTTLATPSSLSPDGTSFSVTWDNS